MRIYRRVLRDWEKTVHECIDGRVRFLKQRRLNKRKKQVLINRVHLVFLNIVNHPFMCSNIILYIPARPTYCVYNSQLIRINRICDNFNTFVKRHKLLLERLIRQRFWYIKLCNSFQKNCKEVYVYNYTAELHE